MRTYTVSKEQSGKYFDYAWDKNITMGISPVLMDDYYIDKRFKSVKSFEINECTEACIEEYTSLDSSA
jgi:hypothetical protein